MPRALGCYQSVFWIAVAWLLGTLAASANLLAAPFTVTPASTVLDHPEETQQLLTTGQAEGGRPIDLTRRLLASEARISSRYLQTGKLGEHEWPKLNQAVGRLAEAPFFIDDDPRCTVMEMRAKARRVNSFASKESDGSSMGIFAATA